MGEARKISYKMRVIQMGAPKSVRYMDVIAAIDQTHTSAKTAT